MNKSRTIQLVIAGKDRVSKVLKSITGGLKKWGVGALKITAGVIAGFAAVTAGLTAMFSKLSDSIDEQAKVAASLGLQNDALGVMRDAAGYAGISVENLTTALKKMSQGIADAANGTGEAKDAISDLGLNAKDLQRMGPEKAFAAIIEKLDQIPNGIKKTALAMDLFGRSGAAMANMTSKGLRQAQKDADALGLKLSSTQAKVVEGANDAWAKIKNAAADFLKYITATLAPSVKKGLDTAFEFIKRQDLKAWATRAALGIATAFQAAVVVLGGVAEAVIAITRGMAGAVDIVNEMTKNSLNKMLGNREKELEAITAKIKKLKSGDEWGWPENSEKLASLKSQQVKKTGQIEDIGRSIDQAQNIDKIVDGVSKSLAAAQGFSTSPAVMEAMTKLEGLVGDLESKGENATNGKKAKATAGRIEIAFSGTEAAINIAKERTQEFNEILEKTGGIAGTSSETTVNHLGQISSILGDITHKANAAGNAIANIPLAGSGRGSAEDFARQLEELSEQ